MTFRPCFGHYHIFTIHFIMTEARSKGRLPLIFIVKSIINPSVYFAENIVLIYLSIV